MSATATTSLETKLLEALRALSLPVPCVGFMETAAVGRLKEQPLSSAQVRVFNLAQTTEAMPMFTVSAEIRVNAGLAESADGVVFWDAFEKIAHWLENIMLADRCGALSTDEVVVDGFQLTGGDKDFDGAAGVWFAVWDLTLAGRIKQEEA